MKKIAIITIYGEMNYGNRLQNYAISHCFKQWGYFVETLAVLPKKPLKKKIKIAAKRKIAVLLPGRYPDVLREANFKRFTKKNIPTRYIEEESYGLPAKIIEEYDYFVVGSDQVWNPCFDNYKKQFNVMFLTTVPPEKKLCFSPSFGVSNLPDAWVNRFSAALNTFPKLSIREEAGANLIYELCGKRADVLIDPTLMLDASTWVQIAKTVTNIQKPYMLEYFLGDISDEVRKSLVHISKVNSYTQFELLDMTYPQIYLSDPGEFIYLISKTSVVCTDSFHACVFSILFDKPFMIFKRKDKNEDMYSRITNLLNLFGIKEEKIFSEKPIYINTKIRDSVLAHEREKVRLFFNESGLNTKERGI